MLAVVFSLFCLLPVFLADKDKDVDYGIIIDAGSTHSGLYIYQWDERESKDSTSPKTIPEQMNHTTKEPGISTCNSQQEINEHLQSLVDWAKRQLTDGDLASLSPTALKKVDIHLKATAGMRILDSETRKQVFIWIRHFFWDKSLSPFRFKDDNAVIISGEEEGAFGWLSVNLLTGKLQSGESNPAEMFGALDLGGMSTQITFAAVPSSDILEDFTSVRLWGANHRLYAHSFLTFGLMGFTTQMAQLSLDKANGTEDVYNPCLFTGDAQGYEDLVDEDGVVINATVNQTGDSQSGLCVPYIKSLFHNNTHCTTGSCTIIGEYQPEVLNSMTFYAFSTFAYAVDGLGLPNTTSIGELVTIAEEMCAMEYEEFLNSSYGRTLFDNGERRFLSSKCLEMSYMTQLLLVYGFDADNASIVFTNKINDKSLGWALGSMLRDVNWLGFEIETGGNGQTDADKAYRAATWLFVAAFAVALSVGGLGFVMIRRKKREEKYDASLQD